MRYAMIVDDDPVSRKILAAKIRQCGVFPIECSDGERAWHTLCDNPDAALLVVDMEMPKVGGRELLERVHARPSLASIPTIIVSGALRFSELSDLMRGRKSFFVPKPIDITVFSQHAQQILGESDA